MFCFVGVDKGSEMVSSFSVDTLMEERSSLRSKLEAQTLSIDESVQKNWFSWGHEIVPIEAGSLVWPRYYIPGYSEVGVGPELR
jgi:hypothetical protein